MQGSGIAIVVFVVPKKKTTSNCGTIQPEKVPSLFAPFARAAAPDTGLVVVKLARKKAETTSLIQKKREIFLLQIERANSSKKVVIPSKNEENSGLTSSRLLPTEGGLKLTSQATWNNLKLGFHSLGNLLNILSQVSPEGIEDKQGRFLKQSLLVRIQISS
ncbi:unnamed protein product [Protopolystoma xenopodis]|uniref:Uncharacterized protein n=1 Tax=Protopolystoma xenopodis TaxID=117903 RepID=A0A448XB59_9PLAT|nr:unnamed protein product [Protopolystoma xenopodis]